MHLVRFVRSFALAKAGSRSAARMAMIAMTTSSSMRVKARNPSTLLQGLGTELEFDPRITGDDPNHTTGSRLFEPKTQRGARRNDLEIYHQESCPVQENFSSAQCPPSLP